MSRRSLESILALFVLVARVCAENDWSTPCFNGQCAYDIPSSSAVSGTLRVWGAPDAISDITPSAGWTILECDAGSLAQDIRLVCSGEDAAACEHLAQTTGSGVGKLVRLPESCGQSAFARVTRDWVHADQSMPEALEKRLRKRAGDGSVPLVKGLALDTAFDNVEQSSAGPVHFSIHALAQSVANENAVVAQEQRRSRMRRAAGLRELTPDHVHEVKDRSVLSVLQQAFQEFNSFNQSTMQKLQEVKLQKTFPLFDEKISCPKVGSIPAFEASVSGAVDACMVANVSLTASAVGTLLPANFTSFGLVVGLDADLEGTLKLTAGASATVDSGVIDLFELGIPGLSFPGILTIGPSFKIQAQAIATLDVEMDLDVDLSYCISNAKLFYPPSPYHNNSGSFSPNNSPLNFSVNPEVASAATIEAHIIPGLDFGINAIGGIAEATVFLDVDTSATMKLSLDGKASVSGSGTKITDKKASLNGCVDIGAGLAVNAGAKGQLFNVFDFAPQANLLTKNFDFFQKCFGVQANSTTGGKRELETMDLGRRDLEDNGLRRRDVAKRTFSLTCPTGGSSVSNLASVVDSVIGANNIKVKN
ncbi:hypothetical protein MKEN_00545900 [Mycena kentingensis (nom. inval.)]|nr:hypothetical protein MKEN_00545900 [Mycena kentingensis (nom. inval.)]